MRTAPETTASKTKLRIGFVGLGHMGGPMAAGLVRAGHKVLGFDLAPRATEQAARDGVKTVGSAAEAVAEADVVVTMLPSGRQVLACYSGGTERQPGGGSGLLAAAKPNTLFVDCSTVDVADARSAHEAALAAGHRALDAPVSGGVAGANAGTLTFMVGGSKDAFASARPMLEVMGGKIVHCGDAGSGQAAKICNNMILGISMIAVSEAFVLGEELGLSHQALFDVASTASGQCWSLTSYCPVPELVPASPANRDYQPGFAAGLMAKDLGLAASAAAAGGVAADLGARAAQVYAAFAEGAGADKDFSAIVGEIRANSDRTDASRSHPKDT